MIIESYDVICRIKKSFPVDSALEEYIGSRTNILLSHLKVNNNSNIEDIITSTEWLNFFEELKTNPSNTCKRFCSVPLNQHIFKVIEHAPR